MTFQMYSMDVIRSVHVEVVKQILNTLPSKLKTIKTIFVFIFHFVIGKLIK